MANEITVTFPRLNQFWNDCGVVGLYRVICGSVHAPAPLDGGTVDTAPLDKIHGVQKELTPVNFTLTGSQTGILHLLEAAHQRVVQRYYNITTKNQIDGKLVNFIMFEHHIGLPVFQSQIILALDCWEHAFMIDYGTKKPQYLEAFVKNVNWDAVNDRFGR